MISVFLSTNRFASTMTASCRSWASPSAWRFLPRRFSTFRCLFSESTQRAMSVRIVSPVACIPYTMSRMNLLCGFEKP